MEIVERPSFIAIGLLVRATWEHLWVDMPKAWQTFRARCAEIDGRCDETLMDISLEKNGEEYVQAVCARVERVGVVPAGMRAIRIPAQTYVFYKHVGPAPAIAESFAKMYAWAESKGYPVGDLKLDMGYTVDGGESEHELYLGLLPIRRWSFVNESGIGD